MKKDEYNLFSLFSFQNLFWKTEKVKVFVQKEHNSELEDTFHNIITLQNRTATLRL